MREAAVVFLAAFAAHVAYDFLDGFVGAALRDLGARRGHQDPSREVTPPRTR
jgi:hypothetical protein